MTLKKGQIIKNEDGVENKVLAIYEDIVSISNTYDQEIVGMQLTEKGLKDRGYTWSEPEWEPEIGNQYWYINDAGATVCSVWENDYKDLSRSYFLGVYPTEEAAIKRRDEIKRKIAN